MKQQRSLKGICLAAGFGTRLQPLTNNRPKAEIPVLNVPSIYYALHKLLEVGITEVGINTHFLAERVKQLVKAAPFEGLNTTISHEPNIMGSGGAYIGLQKWRGESDILVYNPDIISDLDLDSFIDDFYREQKLVSLAVLEPRPYLTPSVHLRDNRVTHIGKPTDDTEPSHCGTGAFLLSNEFFKYLDFNGPSNLSNAINKALNNHEYVGWFLHSGYWQDIGNGANSLFQTNADLLTNSALFESLNCKTLLKKCDVEYQIIQSKESTRFVNSQVILHPESNFSGVNLFFDSLRNDNICHYQNCLLGGDPDLSLHAPYKNKIILDYDKLSFTIT